MRIYDEVAAILYPMPHPDDASEPWYNDACHDIDQKRKEAVFNMEMLWDTEQCEPLLLALNAARNRRDAAEQEIRSLLAYGREFTDPRPYKLTDLAAAAGMSVSGVRTAYDHSDVASVEACIERKPREWRAPV